jgi:hypothetical protein
MAPARKSTPQPVSESVFPVAPDRVTDEEAEKLSEERDSSMDPVQADEVSDTDKRLTVLERRSADSDDSAYDTESRLAALEQCVDALQDSVYGANVRPVVKDDAEKGGEPE